jgi:hypothetical protein
VTIRLTNRQLAEATGWSFPQIRRWVVSFLPPDPKIGQHAGAGVSRKHTVDEAFMVVLGGRLITGHRLTIEEAKAVLEKAIRLLKDRRWMPSDLRDGGTLPSGLILWFGKNRKRTFGYKLQKTLKRIKVPTGERVEIEVEDFGSPENPWRGIPAGLFLGEAIEGFCGDVNEYLADHNLLPAEKDPKAVFFHEEEEGK